MMKMQEINKMKLADQQAETMKLRKEQMNLRFQKAGGQLENPNRWREVRKTVARLKTAMNIAPKATKK